MVQVIHADNTNCVVTSYLGRVIRRGIRLFYGPRADGSTSATGIEFDEPGVALGRHRESETCEPLDIHDTSVVRANRVGSRERLRDTRGRRTYAVAVQFAV